MAQSKSKQEDERSTRDRNFDEARETARRNHENSVAQNTHEGTEGVEVRDLKPVEVINPVLNPATGELEDDTRTIKKTPEEEVGAEKAKSSTASKDSDSKKSDTAK